MTACTLFSHKTDGVKILIIINTLTLNCFKTMQYLKTDRKDNYGVARIYFLYEVSVPKMR